MSGFSRTPGDFEPFVEALARLGRAWDTRAVLLVDAVEELLAHPHVATYGWDEDHAFKMCSDAILTWQDTLYEIELEDDIGEQLLGRVEPLMTRLQALHDLVVTALVEDATEQWARGEIDLDGQAGSE